MGVFILFGHIHFFISASPPLWRTHRRIVCRPQLHWSSIPPCDHPAAQSSRDLIIAWADIPAGRYIMSYLKTVPYSPAMPCASPESQSVYPQYYTCGPGGETFYVWQTFTPDSLDINSPPVSSPDTGHVSVESHTPIHADNNTPTKGGKRRVSANKKERRRTKSLNNAFNDLRNCIPNVPHDTKMSKIKTLKLATTYIAHLMGILAEGKPGTFSGDIGKFSDNPNKKRKTITTPQLVNNLNERRTSGRTGWPQHVWALELKHENPS